MIKKHLIILAALLAAVPALVSAQDKPKVNYAPGREALATETFQHLVNMSGILHQMNLAADLSMSEKKAEAYPELRAAILENILFDYCNVDDSLKTDENRRVTELDGRSSYTSYSLPEWDALGREYTDKRLAIERQARKDD